jgi:hypothetical protein
LGETAKTVTLDKFTRRAKPIRIIGDPDNQLPDKWSSTVLENRELRKISGPQKK